METAMTTTAAMSDEHSYLEERILFPRLEAD
jgi:hypothetical protein